jgi:hypothetical protein
MYSAMALLNEVLGHAVHARMSMESLQAFIIDEMQSGYRPTTRGHAWGVAQYQDLDAAAAAIEAAFHLLKAVQFPETRSSRRADARLRIAEQLNQIGSYLNETGADQHQHNEQHAFLKARDPLG